jgi:hypothetical protein
MSHRQDLKREADSIHSRLVRKIEDRCFTCNQLMTANNKFIFGVGHLFRRYFQSTRWDYHEKGNCHLQCHYCNGVHENQQERGKMKESDYGREFIKRFGEQEFDKLEDRSKEICVLKTYQVEEEIQKLQEALQKWTKAQ